jgi:CheY-like chemotaxis protein
MTEQGSDPAAGCDAPDNLADALLHAVGHPVVVLDVNLRVERASATFHAEFGTTPQACKGQRLPELLGGKWTAEDVEGCFRAALSGERAGPALRCAAAGRVLTLHPAHGPRLVVAFEPAGLQALPWLAHELRAPLGTIAAWTHVLATGGAEPAAETRALRAIERAVKVAAGALDDLLEQVSLQDGRRALEMRPTDLAGLLAAAVESAGSVAEKRGVRLRLQPGLCQARALCDERRVRLALRHALLGVMQEVPRGGEARVGLARSGRWWEVEVRVGAEPGEAGLRAGEQNQDRAIRLALARGLLELHGGSLAACDGLVRLRLPEAPSGTGRATTVPAAATAAGALAGLRVLLVDDDLDTREVLATLLADSGAEVVCAASGAEGLRLLEQRLPDVLVSDIGMPGEDGLVFLGRVRALGEGPARLPALALTAYAGRRERQQALDAGFQDHLPKPVDARELISRVRSLLPRP